MTGRCCIVGGGPAGMTLSLLLARAGVPVTVLEAHRDFDRDFRGDMIHPSTLELLDQIGLVERLHALPHTRMGELRLQTPAGDRTVIVFRRLRTKFPYVMALPQPRFLEFLAEECRRYRHHRLVMGASAQRLIEEEEGVRGVGYVAADGQGEVPATVTIGADGRFSRVRKLAGMEPVAQSAPMDVLWFRLPREVGDPSEAAAITVGDRRVVVLLGREREWQVGWVGGAGAYQRAREEGLEAVRRSVVAAVPWLASRCESLRDWKQVNVLSVEASRLRRWHRPGLLLIGDAAHVMLPVAGVGINCAIADAVECANVLAVPLRGGRVEESLLAEVQRRREVPTRVVQRFQSLLQRRIVGQALQSARPFALPLPMRILRRTPVLRDLPGRLVGLGLRRVRLERPEESPAPPS